MPRTARAAVADVCYHVLNRGNARQQIFHQASDYRAFVKAIREASERLPMRLLAYCLMPNHFHLVVQPYQDGDLSRWMHWLLTAHVRRYHLYHQTEGHLWQGRFKAFPIQDDDHLLTVLRYVERNPLRAGLVQRAEDWPWSSLRWWRAGIASGMLHPGPKERGDGWEAFVNEAVTEAELARLRQSAQRGMPFGGVMWTRETAIRLGLEATLRMPGRPRKRN